MSAYPARLRSYRQGLGDFFEALSLISVHVFICLAAVFMLGFVPQTMELFRIMAEDVADRPADVMAWLPWVVFFLALFLLALSIRWTSFLLLRAHIPGYAVEDTRRKSATTWLLRILMVLPLVAAAIGMGQAMQVIEETDRAGNLIAGFENEKLVLLAGIAVALLLIVLVSYATTRRTLEGLLWSSRRDADLPGSARKIMGLAAVAAFFVLALFWLQPLRVGRIGAVSVMVWFILYLSWALAALRHVGRSWRMPFITLLLVFALAFSLLDANDNHELRPPRAEEPRSTRDVPLDAKDAFRAWLASRKDLARYQGARYPVILVSADGGGMRAAYFTARLLATLQDACPAFAQHVFAISGVSGGSMGAVVYSAIAARHARNADHPDCDPDAPLASPDPGTFRADVHAVLSRDLLAPLLATAVGPDFIARFSPRPLPGADRARTLEDALWMLPRSAAIDMAPMGASVYSVNRYFPEAAVPALFLNATTVETGERFVFSNLKGAEHFSGLHLLADFAPTHDVTLAGAAVASARFPYVTPAAYLMVRPGDDEAGYGTSAVKHRFVDGGYFDNTGIATSLDVLTFLLAMTREKELPPFAVAVMHISNTPDAEAPREGLVRTAARYGLGESLSPVRSMLAARDAREFQPMEHLKTSMALIASQAKIDNMPSPLLAASVLEFGLKDPLAASKDPRKSSQVPLPLGWHLSRQARDAMIDKIGAPRNSVECEELRASPRRASVDNRCSMWTALQLLAHPREGGAAAQKAGERMIQSVPLLNEVAQQGKK